MNQRFAYPQTQLPNKFHSKALGLLPEHETFRGWGFRGLGFRVLCSWSLSITKGPRIGLHGVSRTLTWRFMGSYKYGYKSPNMGY